MSVIHWAVQKTGREGSGDSQYVRTYTLPLQLISNDPNDEPTYIRGYVATLYPLGSPYPPDPGAVVQGYRERQGDDWQIWFVDVLFSSKIDIRAAFGSSGGSGGSGGGGAQNADPLLRAPEVSFAMETYQEAITEDFTNPEPLPIQNSAGDPFLPPVTIEKRRLVMTLKINKPSYNPFTFAALLDFPTVNAENFLNFFPPNTVHYCDHTADSLQENATWYWVLTHKFRINTEIKGSFQGWNPVQILDAGFRQNAGPLAPFLPIVDDTGHRVTSPARLDGSGLELARDEASVYKEFTLYLAANYEVFT